MSVYIDRKFIAGISSRLTGFVVKANSPYLANFRCPICGDSSKKKNKKRGYLYEKKGNVFYHCHNCNVSMAFGTFLKQINPNAYQEYKLERFKNESSGNVSVKEIKTEFKTDTAAHLERNLDLPSIESLSDTKHFAVEYVKKRKIPRRVWNELYFASDYKDFIDTLIPNHGKTLFKEPRLVIPIYDTSKHLTGVTGRALLSTDKKIKYLTMKVHADAIKMYGLDKINLNKKVYVVEGPIDSMFISNSLATMDSSLTSVIPALSGKSLSKIDFIFVYDNEPKNPHTIKNIKNAIKLGQKVCIWPKYIRCKDINEMVLAGMSESEIQGIIDANTFEGLQATLELEVWKK
jgi:hypothetical protein